MVWFGLILLVLFLLMIDIFILHKEGKIVTRRKATIETIIWVLIALTFSIVVYWLFKSNLVNNINNLSPQEAVIKYITGYLIELSLSVDNLFVIAMLFSSFNIPLKHQHKVLFYGILGAIVFRAIMIWAGVLLIQKIDWITYVFGAFLLFTAFKMLAKKEDIKPSKFRNFLYKHLNVSNSLNEDKFWIIENGVKKLTPLFIVLIMIELTDLLFAVDSIPAILAVTTDPFIVFSSNIFAVLGLRAMYFFLADMLERFIYIKYSVFAILVFVSIKLLTLHFYKMPEWFSLTFIGMSLIIGVIVSLQSKPKNKD